MSVILRHPRLALVALAAVFAFTAMPLHGHADGYHHDCLLCLVSAQPATAPVLFWSITLFWVVLSILTVSVVRHDRVWHSVLPATRAPPS